MYHNFLQSIVLSGSNKTTSFVLWSMIIFLVALIGGFGFALINQIKSQKKDQTLKSVVQKPKGF